MDQEEVPRQETVVDRGPILVSPSKLIGRPHACILGEELVVRATELLVQAKDCSENCCFAGIGEATGNDGFVTARSVCVRLFALETTLS
jgi:hypothetical protein